jgi:hypothetical protein
MSIINNLRILLFAGAGAIIFGVLCLLVFFLSAGGSRGAWTALAGVVAAAGLLTINLIFDFRGVSKETENITTEYTFDHSIPQLRQWMYARSQGTRYAIEVFANVQALKDNPHRFDYDMEKITKDMFLFSLVAYIATAQSDWQLEQETYKTSNRTITHWKNKSNATNPNECTPFTWDDIKLLLDKSGNTFANTNVSRFMSISHRYAFRHARPFALTIPPF